MFLILFALRKELEKIFEEFAGSKSILNMKNQHSKLSVTQNIHRLKYLTFTGGGTHIISLFENLPEVAVFAGINPELTGCLPFAANLSEQHEQEAE